MSASVQRITEIPKIREYLRDIGITEATQKRIEEIHSYVQKIVPSKIADIFIIDYVKEDGTHVYEDMDFYTDSYVISAVNFMTMTRIRLVSIKKRITVFDINAFEYNFTEASNKSRLNIECFLDLPHTITCEFKATGKNCDYLMNIISKYFLPNLKG